MWDLGRNSVTSWSMSLTNMFGGSSSKVRQNARERERGSILLTVDLVDHTSHDSPLYHHMNHIPFQQWSPPFPGLAPAETGAAKSLAPWSPAWAAFAGGTWKGTGLRDWDFLWRTGWLVGGLCFFCFLMLCNVFHPTSDDYLNSLIDTHSHVYTYTYIYISFHVYISV